MALLSPAPLTALTEAQALGVLGAALPGNFTRQGVLLVAAQSAVETARWQQMYGWNFGNVTPTVGQIAAGCDYFMHPSTGTMKYRAYAGPLEGAQSMIGWLQTHGALAAAQKGDLAGYMAALHAGSYLGTPGLVDGSGHEVTEQDYVNYQRAIAAVQTELSQVVPVPFDPNRWALIGSVVLLVGTAAYYWRDAIADWLRT